MIRKAKEEDKDIINKFKTKLSLNRLLYSEPNLDILKDNNLDNDITFISIYNNVKVGYLYGYKDKNKAIIDEIYVLDEYRNSNIGQDLVEEFKKWALNNSLKKIEVNIENGNDAYFLFDKMNFGIINVTMNLNI